MPSDSDAKLRAAPHAVAAPASLRKKQLLVVGLAIGLIAALLTQPTEPAAIETEVVEIPSSSLPGAASLMVMSTSAEPASTATADSDEQVTLAGIRELSRIDLATIGQLVLLASEPDQPQRILAARVPEVQAVYGTSQGRTALVGESIVRGGQVLPGGGTVLGVTEEGIRVGRD